MTARLRELAAGLAALVALAAIVAGLPAVLYAFGGSPLPGSWHQLGPLLAGSDDTAVVLAVIRDLAWLAWLAFTACVLTEVAAVLLRRPAPRLRVAGIQGAAAHLVALVALAFTSPSAVVLAVPGAQVVALDREPLPPAPVRLAALDSSAARAAPAPPAVPAVPAVPATPAAPQAPATATDVTVRPGDCLWTISQRYLGAGDRYPEIARLNYGRDMGGGEKFTSAALILPGWRLLLPGSTAAAASDDPPAPVPAPAAKPAPALHPGHATADPRYRRRHATASATRPAGSAPVPGRSNPTARGAAPGNAGSGSAAAPQPAAGHAVMPEAAVFGTGALAGGLVTALTRLRFRQRQERRRGRRIALPADPDVLAAEQRLRTAVHGHVVPTLRDALALLETRLLATGQQLPGIVALHVLPGLLELLLDAPSPEPPPEPFEVTPGRQGSCWQLPLPAAGGPDTDCHLLPGLVTAGTTGDGYLLLDLEALQVTGCAGPPELVARVLQTAAAELTACRWGGWYELILVGFDELAPPGRAEHCDTLDEALEILESRFAQSRQRFDGEQAAHMRELRLADPDDEDWGLTVLVSQAEPTMPQLTRLLDLAVDSWGGIAALVPGDGQAADGRVAPALLQLAPDPQAADGIVASVAPLEVTVRSSALSAAEYEAVGSLFAAAADAGDVGPQEMPYAEYAVPPWLARAGEADPAGGESRPWESGEPGPGQPGDDPDADPLAGAAEADEPAADRGPAATAETPGPDEPAGDSGGQEEEGDAVMPLPADPAAAGVRVHMLGPLAVTGCGAGKLAPKQAELMLALALAEPAGLSNASLCSMMGADPDHPKPTDVIRQLITRTRRRLGRASDGRELILHVGRGHYRLHPDVSLDWNGFRELTRTGQEEDLRAAVELVRGEPLAGTYLWWVDIPLLETMRAEIVDAAETLAELELAADSPRAASRAARAGLGADAAAEQLWRMVMRAEHAAGNLAGVTEAWRRCLDVIEEIAPGGEPHRDTAVLYRRLAGPAPRGVRLTGPTTAPAQAAHR